MATNVDMSGNIEIPADESSRSSFDFNSLRNFRFSSSPLPFLQQIRSSIRPWSEFANAANFKTVASAPRLSGRMLRNVQYFKSNYICVSVVLMIYSLLTSPLLLIVLGAVLYGSHKIKEAKAPVNIFGHVLTPAQQVMAFNLLSIPVLFLVGAGSALFWTLGASCFFTSLHAAFYNIDAIVTEDTEGFLAEVV